MLNENRLKVKHLTSKLDIFYSLKRHKNIQNDEIFEVYLF